VFPAVVVVVYDPAARPVIAVVVPLTAQVVPP
jgi:hypothetical protein